MGGQGGTRGTVPFLRCIVSGLHSARFGQPGSDCDSSFCSERGLCIFLLETVFLFMKTLLSHCSNGNVGTCWWRWFVVGVYRLGVGYFLYTIYLISITCCPTFGIVWHADTWIQLMISQSLFGRVLRVAVSFPTQLWVQWTALCSRAAILVPAAPCCRRIPSGINCRHRSVCNSAQHHFLAGEKKKHSFICKLWVYI